LIVCHCNRLTSADIADGVRCALERCPGVDLCPEAVYEELGTCGQCCNCFPVAEKCISEAVIAFVTPQQAGIVPLAT